MNAKKENSIIGILYAVATIMVLVGAFFRIQHFPNGLSVLIFGFTLGALASSLDKNRLKQKIKRLEEQIEQKD